MWRRIRLLPFDVRIERVDKDLPDKLRRELPGILAWCVRGCLHWQKVGLGTPDTVTLATNEYRRDQDAVGRFLEDCTERASGVKVTAKETYAAYLSWCEHSGESPLSQNRFGRKLTERELIRARGGEGGVYFYANLQLRSGALNELNDLSEFHIPISERNSIAASQKRVQTEENSFSTAAAPPPASQQEGGVS